MTAITQGVITISPEVQSGAAVFAGTRVPVKNLFNYLREGETIQEFLLDFPSVTKEQIDWLLGHLERMTTYSVTDLHAS